MNLERLNFDNVEYVPLRNGLERFETDYLGYLEEKKLKTGSLPIENLRQKWVSEDLFGVKSKILYSLNKAACERGILIPQLIPQGIKDTRSKREYIHEQILAFYAFVDTNRPELETLLESKDDELWKAAVNKTRLALGENELKQYINDPKPLPIPLLSGNTENNNTDEESEEVYKGIQSGIRISREELEELKEWNLEKVISFINKLKKEQPAFDTIDLINVPREVEYLVGEHINLFPNKGTQLRHNDSLSYKRVWDELEMIRDIMLESRKRKRRIDNLDQYLQWLVENRSIGLTG